MLYNFKTAITLKESDIGKWWLDGELVKTIELNAEDLWGALNKYREIVNDTTSVCISKNAIKKREGCYVDDKDGKPKQVGYVVTGSTYFERNNGDCIKKFIDLWVEIRVISYPCFK